MLWVNCLDQEKCFFHKYEVIKIGCLVIRFVDDRLSNQPVL